MCGVFVNVLASPTLPTISIILLLLLHHLLDPSWNPTSFNIIIILLPTKSP